MQKILRKNSTLYRGTTNPNDYKRNSPVYFLYNTNGKNIANRAYTKYPGSKVYTFIVKENLKLLNLGNPNAVRRIMETGQLDSFTLSKNGTIVSRKSNKNKDNEIAMRAKNLGFDGYITPKLGNFHQEIALYQSSNKIVHNSNNAPKHMDPLSTPPKIKTKMKLNLVPPYKSPKKRKLKF